MKALLMFNIVATGIMLAGCASDNKRIAINTVGPAPAKTSATSPSTNGTLVVYSAYRRTPDFDARDPYLSVSTIIDGDPVTVIDGFRAMSVGLAASCIRRNAIQSGEHDVISVPQIAFCENAIVLPDSEFRCDTKCAISRLVRSALSQRDKSVRFPFPFPWQAIGVKRETIARGAPIRVGPGESVTRSDRRGSELELESPCRRSPAPREWNGAATRISVRAGNARYAVGKMALPHFS